jgi:hypothetical protein
MPEAAIYEDHLPPREEADIRAAPAHLSGAAGIDSPFEIRFFEHAAQAEYLGFDFRALRRSQQTMKAVERAEHSLPNRILRPPTQRHHGLLRRQNCRFCARQPRQPRRHVDTR